MINVDYWYDILFLCFGFTALVGAWILIYAIFKDVKKR